MTDARTESGALKLLIHTAPQQGATYQALLAATHTTEPAGLHSFFRSDHNLYRDRPSVDPKGPLPEPTDAWRNPAELARETKRIRFGTLVSSATFPLPGSLALSVAHADSMSGGGVELGLGGGEDARGHDAYKIPFPESVRERFDLMEDQLAIITGLRSTKIDEMLSCTGRYCDIVRTPALPNPLQRLRSALIVGGFGTKRLPVIAARFADECDGPWGTFETCRALSNALDAARDHMDRDPRTVHRSTCVSLCVGENAAECERRADAIKDDLRQLREKGEASSPREVADRISLTSRRSGTLWRPLSRISNRGMLRNFPVPRPRRRVVFGGPGEPNRAIKRSLIHPVRESCQPSL